MQSDESLTQLTHFAPLEAESKQSGGIFSRLFKRNNSGNNEASKANELTPKALVRDDRTGASSSAPASTYSSPSHVAYVSRSSSRASSKDRESDNGKEMQEEQRRTLSSVMRRLGNILEKRGQTPQAYKDSDFRQYWMPDSNCKQCYECGDRFTTFRRRHHCRICGQIFCSRCCNQEVPGKIMGYTVTVIDGENEEREGYLRVCTYCCKVVLNFAQNINTSAEDVPSGLKENLQETRSKLESYGSNPQVDQPWVSPLGRRSKPTRVHSFYGEDLKLRSVSELDLSTAHNPFDITPQSDYANPQTILEERRAMLKDSVQLRELWLTIQDPYNGIELQSHRHRLRTYPNCIIGSELVDWLVSKDKVNSRVQAVVIGQALVDACWLECITIQEQIFLDTYTLYKPGETAINDQESEVTTPQDSSFLEDDSEPQWFREISGETDSESELSSDLNKIPSTLSAPHLQENIETEEDTIPKSQSVFYIDSKPEGSESPHIGGQRIIKARARHSSGATIGSMESGRNAQHSYIARINAVGPINIELAQREIEGFMVIGCKDSPPTLPGNSSRLSMDTQSPGSRGSAALTESVVSLDPQIGWQSLENLREENGERQAYQRICQIQWDLVNQLTRQLLNKEELSFKWCDVIMNITRKISKLVRPDVKHEHDDMDIRQYVQIKKIPGANRGKTEIISGVVCTKNIQHRKMRPAIQSPRILLLRGSIEYQRVENKFSSLEPQILQEHEYLKNCVARIAALKPDILLVEKTVSRVGQEFILDTGITLVSNVKPSVMERVARFTQADIVTSIDGLVSKTTLGFCTTFKVQNYKLPDGRCKTLMYFEGCAHHLGCTVILRGGLSPELAKVKKILQFVAYVCYHLRLELSYLMDSFAMPPPLPEENILELNDEDLDTKSQDSKSVTFTLDADEPSIASSFKDSTMSECVICPYPISNGSAVQEEQKMVQPFSDGSAKEENHVQPLIAYSTNSMEQKLVQPPNQILVTPEISTPVLSQEQDMTKLTTSAKGIAKQHSAESNISKHQVFEHLEVTENPFIRTRSNGSDLRRFADIKRHKRSVSDYAGDSSLPTTTTKTSKEISDFSDPLQEYQRSKDESIFQKDDIKLTDHTKKIHIFKKALGDVVISISPLMKFEVPYLETEHGSKCKLRQYFQPDLYWSVHLEGENRRNKGRSNHIQAPDQLEDLSFSKLVTNQMSESHEFFEKKFTVPINDQSVQTVVADFRARGGRLIQKHLAHYQNSLKRSAAEKNGSSDTNNNSAPWENRTDCLDTSNHQRIAVLFSSFSTDVNCNIYCVSPWVVTMDYYGRNDITLGGFLERYCFKESYNCPSEVCVSPIVDHIRRFVHDNGCLTVMLKKLEQPFPNFQNNILMWAWCRKCRQVTPVVPISLDTWSMSFAKYLELHFHGHQYGRRASAEECVHNLHQDHFQYFGYKQIVASFKHSEIILREIALPPIIVFIRPIEVDVKALNDEAKMLNYKGTTVFNAVIQSLLKLQHDAQYANFISDLDDKENQLQSEQGFYRKKIEALSTMLNDLSAVESIDEQQNLLFVIQDLVLEIKRQVARAVVLWNERFQDLDVQSKKLNKSLANQAKSAKASTVSMDGAMAVSEPIETPTTASQPAKEAPASASSKSSSSASPGISSPQSTKSLAVGKAVDIATKATPDSSSDCVLKENEQAVFTLGDDDTADKQLCEKCGRYSNRGVSKIITQKCGHEICRICFYENNALCPACPKHMTRRRASMIVTESMDDLIPGHFGSPRGHWPPASHNMGQSPQEKSAQLDSSRVSSNESTVSCEGNSSAKIEETTKVPSDSKVQKLESNNDHDKPKEKPSSTTGMKNIISSLLYNSGAIQIQMPFTPDEHHLLPPCDNIPVIVYDEEPSSLIAYALSSKEYHDQLEDLKIIITNENNRNQNNKRASNKVYDPALATYSFDAESVEGKKGNSLKVLSFFKSASDGVETVKKGTEVDVQSVRYTPGKESLDENEDTDFAMFSAEGDKTSSLKSKQKEAEISYHIELQFNDSSAKFYCRVYYAEQFQKLRTLIFPDGEERFIRSLSRCYTWLARGGKSGSTFCKTQDDRFILKQMSKYEVQSFVEFAPHYFHYMTKAVNEQKPTALAKILGVFKIGFKNNQNSASLKQDVLIMENLFYDRKITQIFDLKGSVRNRLVNTSGKRVEELVLLDENLLKLSLESPMYIRPHSKTVLTLGITNDTQFLSSHLVMDYSLLVGIDDNTKELVVGIIDYIRTFTWDKKIEMVVKSGYSHISGQGKMPTVVSPELYRSRFLEAMDRYFLHVPDRWTGLGQNVDC